MNQHLKSARANRADAEATRAKAKALRDKIVQQRQKDANAERERTKRNKLARDQSMLEQGQGVKAVHDGIYRAKFVPSQSAELLEKAKYGKSTTT